VSRRTGRLGLYHVRSITWYTLRNKWRRFFENQVVRKELEKANIYRDELENYTKELLKTHKYIEKEKEETDGIIEEFIKTLAARLENLEKWTRRKGKGFEFNNKAPNYTRYFDNLEDLEEFKKEEIEYLARYHSKLIFQQTKTVVRKEELIKEAKILYSKKQKIIKEHNEQPNPKHNADHIKLSENIEQSTSSSENKGSGEDPDE
jgi:hypothetical protein